MSKYKLLLYLLTALIIGLLLSSPAFAANIGKISGKVLDRETGEPLPSVAVSVVGTNMGGLTDQNGQYFILNVPVGQYSIKAELVGYQSIEKKGIFVSVDLTAYVDFELSSKAIDIGEVQIVQAERPLVIKDQTATLRLISGDEVRNLPTRGYQDVVGLSTGVVAYSDNATTRQRGGNEVSNTPTLNIRGGRKNEVGYYIDGFETKDPQTGLATTSINNNAIEEVSITTGGFNAEYGWIASGAINVTTKEGSPNYSGNLEGVTSELTDEFGYNVTAFDLNGPLWPNSDKASFFVSGERRIQKDRSPRALNDGKSLNRDDLRGWTWQGKIRYDFSKSIILRGGILGSIDQWSQYMRTYHFNSAHMPYFEDKNNSIYLQLTHNLNPRTFYEVKANYFSTSRQSGDGLYFNNLWSYNRPNNPRFDETSLFWSYNDPSTNYQVCCDDGSWCSPPLAATDPIPEDAPCDADHLIYRYKYALKINDNGVPKGDSAVLDESHVYDDYMKRSSSYYGFNFDIVHQLASSNEVKLGFEYQRNTLRYIDHLTPVQLWKGEAGGGLNNIDKYGYDIEYIYEDTNVVGAKVVEVNGGLDGAKHPYNFALYLQDKFEHEGLVINAGLRYDYLNVNTMRLKNEENPLDPDSLAIKFPNDSLYLIESQKLTSADLENAKAEQRLSPRLGIGFPVTDRTVFHLYYGKFFQRPELQYLYVSYKFLEYMVRRHPYFYPIGNPNLEPEETTAYEVGITHQLGDNTRFDLTAYYKDVKNLTEVDHQPSRPNGFDTYRNQDYGTIKGIELAVKMRRMRNIAVDIAYTFAYANGTGSYPTSHQNIAWVTSEKPLRVSPLDFDQRHKITAVVDVRTGKGEGPKLGNFFPLERAGLNLVFNIASGTAYSPTITYDEATLAAVSPTPDAPMNSRYGPWTYRLDLKANRTFKIAALDFDFYVWVLNLFNSDNVIDVYESTGQPDNTGWLATPPGQQFIETYADPDPITGLTGQEKYWLKERDPNNYDIPRMIRFGIRMSF